MAFSIGRTLARPLYVRAARRPVARRRHPLGRGWVLATFVALGFFVLWSIIPFLWMIMASLKENKEIYRDFTILPKHVYWGHYLSLVSGKFGVWTRNSALVAVVVTTLSLVLGALGAYSITRLRYTGRSLTARLLIFTYLLPSSLLFIPLFRIIVGLGLSNTLASLMLVYPTFTLPFCTWMLMSYFRSIPVELEEAALIDGCGRIGVLMRITIPLSLPAIAVVALFSFTQAWNEFLYAIVFTNSVSTRTVTAGLTQMMGEDVFFWGQMMAGSVLAALPPVIMYTLAQRLVIRGLTVGGIKG